jgi:hypothetical protein
MEGAKEELLVHFDETPQTSLRARIFGHEGVIIPFREGIIAKKCRIMQELHFYRDYKKWIHNFLPQDLVPTVEGVVTTDSELSVRDNQEIRLSLRRNLSSPNLKNDPYIILRDLAQGFEKPALLDIKLGTRTWAFGAPAEKIRRMKGKCRECPTHELRFRIRAGMWYSRFPDAWSSDDDTNYVTREFGNTCTEGQLWDFLNDFFHWPATIPYFIKKLTELRSSLNRLRNECNARLYSSSVLFVYDEANPSKMECRILDFAKTYIDAKSLAASFNERPEECEDDVIPAITNLVRMLRKIGRIDGWCSLAEIPAEMARIASMI